MTHFRVSCISWTGAPRLWRLCPQQQQQEGCGEPSLGLEVGEELFAGPCRLSRRSLPVAIFKGSSHLAREFSINTIRTGQASQPAIPVVPDQIVIPAKTI